MAVEGKSVRQFPFFYVERNDALTRYPGSSIGVEIGVDFVEEIKWCWIAFLNRKDCAPTRQSRTGRREGKD